MLKRKQVLKVYNRRTGNYRDIITSDPHELADACNNLSKDELPVELRDYVERERDEAVK